MLHDPARAVLRLMGVLGVLVGSAASAQAPSAGIAARAGMAVVGTGDQVNCARAGSAVGGIEARSAGRWFLAATADLHMGLPLVCTDVATVVVSDAGKWVYEDGGVFFALAPRLGVRAGRTHDQARLTVEPSVGAGVVWSTELGGSRTRAQPWLSGAVALARTGSRWSVQGEGGAHRVELRYRTLSGDRELDPAAGRRPSARWQPLVQLGLRRAM